MSEYNQYPKDMIEINPCSSDKLLDLLVYCWESTESRQAYKGSDFTGNHEQLRIVWIKKEFNLGYAIGMKLGNVKYYKIGSDENWHKFKFDFANKFSGDCS